MYSKKLKIEGYFSNMLDLGLPGYNDRLLNKCISLAAKIIRESREKGSNDTQLQ